MLVASYILARALGFATGLAALPTELELVLVLLLVFRLRCAWILRFAILAFNTVL